MLNAKHFSVFLLFISSLNLSASTSFSFPFSTKIGTRLQGVASQTNTATSSTDTVLQDMFIRRARLQVELKWDKGWSQYFDVRNDSINREDSGEGSFRLGDGFVQKKWKSGKWNQSFKFFRGKVDISRSLTVSSSRLLYLNRPLSIDNASDYISHARRATNIQWNGNFNNYFEWHLVAGDGVEGSKFEDLAGNTINSLRNQRLAVGSRLRINSFKRTGKLTETLKNSENGVTLGVGFFNAGEIKITNSSSVSKTVDRNLFNADLTINYGIFTLLAEYTHFSDVYLNFDTDINTTSSSSAYVAQSELRVHPKNSLFLRYEFWDRYEDLENYGINSYVMGLNHYIDGNKYRLGAYFDLTEYESGFSLKSEKKYLVTAMLHLW